MIINKKKKVIFAELPRTGTTSIRSLLIALENWEGDVDLNRRHISVSNYLRRKKLNEKEFKIISCIRNPMDRLHSQYM